MEIPKANKATQIKSRLLLLKKIRLKNFPELSKNLKDFFWNSEKYFKSQFKNYYIAINHEDNKKEKINFNKRKTTRTKTKKSENSSFYSPDKRHLNDSKITNVSDTSRFFKKKGISKNINCKEIGLKAGQKYINDFELEDLFNTFKTVHEINKKKDKDFITAKEYMENNNSLLLGKKTLTNFNKVNKQKSQNKEEFKINSYSETVCNTLSPQKKNINPLNTINSDYYKTTSTFMSVNKEDKNTNNLKIINSLHQNNNSFPISKIHLLKKDLYLDEEKLIHDKKSKTANNFYGLSKLEERNIILRNKLIKKQNQFLKEEEEEKMQKHKAKKNIFANLLSNQEKTLAKSERNKSKINNIYIMLAKKAKRSKETLLMTNINSYRIKKELRDKFSNLNSNLEPEHSYNWIKDLRELKLYKNNINNKNCDIRQYSHRVSVFLPVERQCRWRRHRPKCLQSESHPYHSTRRNEDLCLFHLF